MSELYCASLAYNDINEFPRDNDNFSHRSFADKALYGLILKSQLFELVPGDIPGDFNFAAQFAVYLFAGLILHGLLAECLTRGPRLVLDAPNLVKRVVFPLEVFPWMVLGSALFTAVTSFAVMLVGAGFILGHIPWTVIFAPLVILPLCFLGLALGWFLAGLGVFLRDIGQIVPLISTILLFMSPIFFPIEALPEAFRPLVFLNPLSLIVVELRAVALEGRLPNWEALLIYAVVASVLAWASLVWFRRMRPHFADFV